MIIKICGIFRECDIDYVNDAMPDMIGFVFAPSRRRVSFELANKLKSLLNPEIKTVGVFVNENIDIVKNVIKEGLVDFVQLHGQEDEEYISLLNFTVIKAISLGVSAPDNSDYILMDSVIPGSGVNYDWSKIPIVDKPLFLAGGINLENIEEAINLAPYGIDVSSGVETDGFKDRVKIREIVRRVKNVRR